MSTLRVDTDYMASVERDLGRMSTEMQNLRMQLNALQSGYASDVLQKIGAHGRFSQHIRKTGTLIEDAGRLSGGIRQSSDILDQCERQIRQLFEGNAQGDAFAGKGAVGGVVASWQAAIAGAGAAAGVMLSNGTGQSVWDRFAQEFSSNYGLGDLLKGSGYIGTIYDFIQDIKKGGSWSDLLKTGVDIFQFLSGAATTFSNYRKIGNAVGTTKAMTWWAKSVTGIKSLGRASTAKNPFTRFANNLTNKTSPFNAQWKNVIGNFKGANGVGKAVAAWGGVAVDGALNWFSNKEEQANSNGEMSDGRVIAETITETAVGTVLTYGAGIVVGAGVTAVLGTVAAPGIVVVALTGGVVAGINAGVNALTGKPVTEWVSDAILDGGKAIGDALGSAAKGVKESLGKWFGKLAF